MCFIFFFFNDTATTEIYTLSLHDALPICQHGDAGMGRAQFADVLGREALVHLAMAHPGDDLDLDLGRDVAREIFVGDHDRSEEHTSELQSHSDLVCRLLLEKKKKKTLRNQLGERTDSAVGSRRGRVDCSSLDGLMNKSSGICARTTRNRHRGRSRRRRAATV